MKLEGWPDDARSHKTSEINMHHWVQRGEGGVINDGTAAAAVFNAPFSALHYNQPNTEVSDCLGLHSVRK